MNSGDLAGEGQVYYYLHIDTDRNHSTGFVDGVLMSESNLPQPKSGISKDTDRTQQEWITSMVYSGEKALISAPFCFSGCVVGLSVQSKVGDKGEFHRLILRNRVPSPLIHFICRHNIELQPVRMTVVLSQIKEDRIVMNFHVMVHLIVALVDMRNNIGC